MLIQAEALGRWRNRKALGRINLTGAYLASGLCPAHKRSVRVPPDHVILLLVERHCIAHCPTTVSQSGPGKMLD